jgi:hypothetical protein
MLAWKYLLMILGVGLFGSAGALVVYDVYLSEQLRRLLARSKTCDLGTETGIKARRPFGPARWRLAQRLAISGVLPMLLALSIVVIPGGSAGVRVSQIWGARRGTLYPGGAFRHAERFEMDGTKRLYRLKSVLLVPLANTPVGGSGRVAGKEERS